MGGRLRLYKFIPFFAVNTLRPIVVVRLLVCLWIISQLSACESKLTVQTVSGPKSAESCTKANTKKICAPATKLSFGSSALTTSRLITAVWSKSPSEQLAGQKIQIFKDEKCSQDKQSGTDIDLTPETTERYNLIADGQGIFSFKIISVGKLGDSIVSDCSTSIKYALTALATESNEKIAPTITEISPKATSIDKTRSGIKFTISDNTTLACTSQYLQLLSSNESVVTSGTGVWGGSYPNCTLAVTPVTGATGNATLTIRVTDAAGNSANSSFTINVSDAIVIGQPYLDSAVQYMGGQSGPEAVYVAGDKLYVSDFNNSRILVWNSFPTSSGQNPDGALGQIDTGSLHSNGLSVSQSLYAMAAGMTSDGTRFAVSDRNAHRILIWNSIPKTNMQAPDLVLGQPDFTTSLSSTVSSTTSTTLDTPYGITSCGGKLIVADQRNNRVLIWNSFPTANQAAADVVIGQTTMTGNGSGQSSSTLNTPAGVFCNGSKLLISDVLNNRVLIYNSVPTVNGASADLVVGQSNFTNNASATTASGLSGPKSAYTDGTRLIVADSGNSRTLIWTTMPTTNGQAANLVLGQADFISGSTVTVSASSHKAAGVAMYGEKLIVTDDYGASRTLIWNSFPTSNNQPADIVLGQPNFLTSGQNYADPTTSLNSGGIFTDGTKLFLADSGRHRVLIWNSLASASTQNPDIILGQSDLTGSTSGSGASGLLSPSAVYYDGTKVYVADSGHHRVLIWNSMPTGNNQAANVVVGQANFTTTNSGRSSTTMNRPSSLLVNGGKLYVGEIFNYRIMVWNPIPTASGQAANFVIGQTNFTNNTSGCSASTFASPSAMVVSGGKLIVSDNFFSRLLIWNTLPTTSGSSADVVVGQPDLTTCNWNGNPSVNEFRPYGLAIGSGGKLYVSDETYNRILYWNSIPTANAMAPDGVFGQSNFVSGDPNAGGGMSGSVVNQPQGIATAGGRLMISDTGNYRILSISQP
jgi:hypothetical protein